jgi:hypothetical protein
MSAQKKITRTDYMTKHEPKILGGQYDIILGWFGASSEAIKLKVSASEYAQVSISVCNSGEARHSNNTIRQNVTAGMKLLKKYGTIDNAIIACEKTYATASWNSLKTLVAGDGQRAKTSKPKQFDAKREAKKYTKAQLLKMLETK